MCNEWLCPCVKVSEWQSDSDRGDESCPAGNSRKSMKFNALRLMILSGDREQPELSDQVDTGRTGWRKWTNFQRSIGHFVA
jgi:hypothetical protein